MRCGRLDVAQSLGHCCQVAGMQKEDFIRFLGEKEVSIFNFDDGEEFTRVLANTEAVAGISHD